MTLHEQRLRDIARQNVLAAIDQADAHENPYASGLRNAIDTVLGWGGDHHDYDDVVGYFCRFAHDLGLQETPS